MANDDDFDPKLGRMRSGSGKRARRYLGRVLAATNLARAGRGDRVATGSFSGARHGRGAGVGRLLSARTPGRRRVVVKASIVKLRGKGAAAAAAHLRYLQRDGTTREGDPGALYDRDGDAIEARAFHHRTSGDRHQFRFIVSAEDGHQFDELKPLTRRLMARLEEDLGTGLDWVAVDHFNTGHPHTHIVVRGVDDRGKDLVIARDYLTRGIRERAVELVELDLGPPSAREVADRLRREVQDERLTSIDRALLRDADASRDVRAAHRDPAVQSLRAGRLATLARMGLAEGRGAGRYRLAADLAATLRRIGERGDIIRTMQRAFSQAGIARAAADQAIFQPVAGATLIGRVVARGLADEAADRHFVIVEAIDGRAHYVGIGRGEDSPALGAGSIISVAAREATPRAADRAIAAVASANRGRYDIEAHLAHDRSASDTFAAAHVRRLEALRRGGVGVTRSPQGQWTIPGDYLEQVERWEEGRVAARPVAIDLLSPKPLDQLPAADAATWLDRRIADPDAPPARAAGFGAAVRHAESARRQWLVDQGLADNDRGNFTLRRDALAILQRRELSLKAGALAREIGKPFAEAQIDDRVDGVYRRRVDLLSGRFALLERSHDFTLVPWRASLEQAKGKTVTGVMRESGVNWSLGRGRGGPTIS